MWLSDRLHTVDSGPVDCIMKTMRREGVLALFKGSLTSALGQVPNNAIVFGSYGR